MSEPTSDAQLGWLRIHAGHVGENYPMISGRQLIHLLDDIEQYRAERDAALALADARGRESAALRTGLEIIAGCPSLQCVRSLCAAALAADAPPAAEETREDAGGTR